MANGGWGDCRGRRDRDFQSIWLLEHSIGRSLFAIDAFEKWGDRSAWRLKLAASGVARAIRVIYVRVRGCAPLAACRQ